MPSIFINGLLVNKTTVHWRGFARVTLRTTFPHGTLLFTLDGSVPDVSSSYYTGSFLVKTSATLRAKAYNADFTQSVQSDPLEIIILPTLTARTEGGGAVAIDPFAGSYFNDGTALATATPAPGWTFLQWLGDATGTNATARVNMNRDKCVQAVFGTSVNNTVVGSGTVIRQPAAVTYPYGTPVHLTAVPKAGNYFALWGNALNGTNNPTQLVVTNSNATATAVFGALPTGSSAMTVVVDGFGSVVRNPGANRYSPGATVTLMASPDVGQNFLGWSGDANGTNNPLMVTMGTSSKTLTANFTKRPTLVVQPCSDPSLGDGFQFLLTGEFGARYQVDKNDNWQGWSPLAVVTNAFGTTQFNDASATNQVLRVYRAVGAP